MSSDQILIAIAEIEHTTDAREIERAQVRAIAEVAYQLAIQNERSAWLISKKQEAESALKDATEYFKGLARA